MDEKKTFEDKVVEFSERHPYICLGGTVVGSLLLAVASWKFQTRNIAKGVAKELAKNR